MVNRCVEYHRFSNLNHVIDGISANAIDLSLIYNGAQLTCGNIRNY